MSKGTAYIVGAGDFTARGLVPGPRDLLIAADGGYDSLRRLGIRPHLLLGDMDSITGPAKGVARLRFPPEKDLTDMALAIRLARARGYRRFKLFGATGGRMDHSLANLQSLAGLAKEGLRGSIIAPEHSFYALANGVLRFPPVRAGTVVSVFCLGPRAEGVSIQGLKYPLDNVPLDPFVPLGVSNETTGEAFRLSVREGVLIVMLGVSPDQAPPKRLTCSATIR